MLRLTLFVWLLGSVVGRMAAQHAPRFFTPLSDSEIIHAARKNWERRAVPRHFDAYRFDLQGFKQSIQGAPKEFTPESRMNKCLVQLPLANGSTTTFTIWKTDIMHPDLAAKFPEIGTFAGESVENQGIQLSFVLSVHGLSASIYYPDLSVDYIEPMYKDETTLYQCYNRLDYPFETEIQAGMSCGVHHSDVSTPEAAAEMYTPGEAAADRGTLLQPFQLKIYRFAVSTTGEYAQDNGGTLDKVMARVVEHVTKITTILERDAQTRLQLIPNNEILIFLDPDTDPFFGQVADYMGQNPQVLNSRITINGYDLGHNFCRYTGGDAAGIAGGQACTDGKGRGCSSGSGNYGDYFISVAAHEVGHQLSASHTFNSCGPTSQRVGSSSWEIGSGSTIMSYAGACGTNNVQNDADHFFHAGTIEQIQKFVKASTCGKYENTGNSHPVVSLPYTNGFFIPILTPFELTGSATDPDGHALTYSWEQMDLGPETSLQTPVGDSPLFRVRKPVSQPNRYFPTLTSVILGTSSVTEHLPSYSRNLNFRLLARDNQTGGGGVGWANVSFKATADAGPFVVKTPNTADDVWHTGTYQLVTWDVANTHRAPVDCQKVNISLSLNGGQTYPITLISGVENDGSQYVLVPENLNPQSAARVRVSAADNVFYDISNRNFKIIAPTQPSLSLAVTTDAARICLPDTFSTEIKTVSVLGFNAPIHLHISNLPAGAVAQLSRQVISPGESATLNIDFSKVTEEATFHPELQAIVGTDTLRLPLTIRTVSNNFSQLLLHTPADGTTGASIYQTLKFSSVPDASTYDIQIASDASFKTGTIVEEKSNLTADSLKLTVVLKKAKAYFWRVRPRNECGIHDWTEPNFFSTLVENCYEQEAKDLPKNLSANGTPSFETDVVVNTPGTVSDLNVRQIKGFHNSFKDLELTLTSPSGTMVPLFRNKCGTISVAFNFGLDNQAPNNFQCPPNNLGLYVRPDGNLGNFTGESVTGKWTFKVRDINPGGGGSIEALRLEFCAIAAIQPPFLVNNNKMDVESGKNRLISPDLLLVNDANNSPQQLTYTLLSLPKNGRLQADGQVLGLGAQFTQQDLNDGKIRYYDFGWNKGSDHFRFIVDDNEGGWLPSTVFTINPTTVNTGEPVGQSVPFQLFPNPADESVIIYFQTLLPYDTRMLLFSADGKLMKTQTLPAGEEVITLKINDLPQGLYFIVLENAQGRAAKRLVKK